MKDQPASPGAPSRTFNWRRFVIWLVIVVVLVLMLFIVVPVVDPACVSLLFHSGEISIPLPANCARVAGAPADGRVSYLEKERNRRGLIFKEWISCDVTVPTHALESGFEDDPRWLPSYVPGAYQFRRAVVILPCGQDIPQGSRVAAEVSLVPWRRYVSQIAGACGGKFSVWK